MGGGDGGQVTEIVRAVLFGLGLCVLSHHPRRGWVRAW